MRSLAAQARGRKRSTNSARGNPGRGRRRGKAAPGSRSGERDRSAGDRASGAADRAGGSPRVERGGGRRRTRPRAARQGSKVEGCRSRVAHCPLTLRREFPLEMRSACLAGPAGPVAIAPENTASGKSGSAPKVESGRVEGRPARGRRPRSVWGGLPRIAQAYAGTPYLRRRNASAACPSMWWSRRSLWVRTNGRSHGSSSTGMR